MVLTLNASVCSSTITLSEATKMDRKQCLRKNRAEGLRLQTALNSCAKDEKSTLQRMDHTISEVVVELKRLKLFQSNTNLQWQGTSISPSQKKGTGPYSEVSIARGREEAILPAIAVTYAEDEPADPAVDTAMCNPYPISFRKNKEKKKNASDWWNSVIHPQGIFSTPASPRCSMKSEFTRPLTPDIYCDHMDCIACRQWAGHPQAISSIRRPKKSASLEYRSHSYDERRLSSSPVSSLVDFNHNAWQGSWSSFGTGDSSNTSRSTSRLSLHSFHDEDVSRNGSLPEVNSVSHSLHPVTSGSVGHTKPFKRARRSSVHSSEDSHTQSKWNSKLADTPRRKSISNNRLSPLCMFSETVERRKSEDA